MGVYVVEIVEVVEFIEFKFVFWKKIFVLGGNGYVGMYICKEVFVKSIFVVSLS